MSKELTFNNKVISILFQLLKTYQTLCFKRVSGTELLFFGIVLISQESSKAKLKFTIRHTQIACRKASLAKIYSMTYKLWIHILGTTHTNLIFGQSLIFQSSHRFNFQINRDKIFHKLIHKIIFIDNNFIHGRKSNIFFSWTSTL